MAPSDPEIKLPTRFGLILTGQRSNFNVKYAASIAEGLNIASKSAHDR